MLLKALLLSGELSYLADKDLSLSLLASQSNEPVKDQLLVPLKSIRQIRLASEPQSLSISLKVIPGEVRT